MNLVVFSVNLCYTNVISLKKGEKFMFDEKKQILATINTLPNNITLDDSTYTLYLHSKLNKSKNDIKNGRVITIDESKERMRKKYENFNIK